MLAERVSSARAHDLRGLARSGSLNLVGGVATAVLTLVLTLVVTRGMGVGASGAFLATIALFQVAAGAATLGVDTGLVRAVSGRTAAGGHRLGRLLVVALVPVGVAGVGLAALGRAHAPRLGALLGGTAFAGEVAAYVGVLAPFVPMAAILGAILGASRGYGTMRPTVVLERVARPAAQVGLVVAVIAAGAGAMALAWAWAFPYLALALLAAGWMVSLARSDGAGHSARAPDRRLFVDFWSFTAPRSLASISRVALQWLDIVLVGVLASPEAAAIYAVATRLLQFGVLAAFAVAQAAEPRFGAALAEGGPERAVSLYRASTAWLILLTWPIYLVVTIFAPALLALFGPEFVSGAPVVMILVAAVLIGSALGPVDVLLVMAGKSTWSLWNSGLGLGVSVGLNVVLIPRLGIAGAAVAWAVTRVLLNVLPLRQVSRLLAFRPFGDGSLLAAALALGIFGVLGMVARLALGPNLASAAACCLVAGGIYVIALRRFRHRLDLAALGGIFSRRHPARPIAAGR